MYPWAVTRAVPVLAALTGLATLGSPTLARAEGTVVLGPGASSARAHVVVVREGTRAVVTLAPGLLTSRDRAVLVLPLEGTPKAGSIRVIEHEPVDVVDRLGAPRLVELWEADPCTTSAEAGAEPPSDGGAESTSARAGDGGTRAPRSPLVAARRSRGPYADLFAGEQIALTAWLATRGASGFTPQPGAYLAVAVEPSGLTFMDGVAMLPPVRVEVTGERLGVPLSRAPGSGPIDVIVSVLSRGRVRATGAERFLDGRELSERARERFAGVAQRGFEGLLPSGGGAVTEYAWSAGACGACPGPTIGARELAALGGDALGVVDAAARSAREVAPSIRPSRPRLVSIDKPTVSGPLPEALVASAVFDQRARVRACYDAALARAPDAAGFVRVSLAVSKDGQVASSATDGSTLPDATARACVEKIYQMFAFPRRDAPSTVRFDVHLAPTDPLALAPPPPPLPREAMWTGLTGFVLSRVHARFEDARADVALEDAPAREHEARFVIHHAFAGPVTCAAPTRGRWGARPGFEHPFGALAAQPLPRDPRVDDLAPLLPGDAGSGDAGASDASVADAGAKDVPRASSGCGACVMGSAPPSRGSLAIAFAAGLAYLARRRRR